MDSFHLSEKRGIVTILSQCEGQTPLEPLINLGLAYAPIVVVTHELDEDEQSYTIAAQEEAALDLVWLRSALSRFDDGWTIQDGWLVSPMPSRLRHTDLMQVLRQGVRTEIAA